MGIGSLTMSYFHTGTRTIIGAESFHCPVRDGKEWDQLAMVIRLKLSPNWHPGRFSSTTCQFSQFAESFEINMIHIDQSALLIARHRESSVRTEIHRYNVFESILEFDSQLFTNRLSV